MTSQGRPFWRQHIKGLSVVAILLTLIGLCGGLVVYPSAKKNNDDGRARDAAVVAYGDRLSQETQGAITIMPNDIDSGYSWQSDTKMFTVYVRLGSCAHVKGTFTDVPRSPAASYQLGELWLTVPSVNSRDADTAVDASVGVHAKNFYPQIASSALAHCIAGDERLLPKHGG